MLPSSDSNIFPYGTARPDINNGTFNSLLLSSKLRGPIELGPALEKCLKESKDSPFEITQRFLSSFTYRILSSVKSELHLAFLKFDHDDDDGPTFDDKYLLNVAKIRQGLIDRTRQLVQYQSQILGNNATKALFEKGYLRSLIIQETPESILAQSLDEGFFASRRRQIRATATLYPDSNGPEFLGSLEHFEIALAKYRIRQRGLKLRNNIELILSLTDEIRKRTAASDAEAELRLSEQESSDQSGSELNSDIEDFHTNRGEIQEPGSIWKHLTISRDETSASDFLHERIVILFFKARLVRDEQTGTWSTSFRGIESPKISQPEQQTQPHCKRFLADSSFGQTSSHHTLPRNTLLGMQADQWSSPSFGQLNIGAADTEAAMVGFEEDGGNSLASTPESDSFRCRQLLSRIASLELETERLKTSQATCQNWKVIHFITDSTRQESSGYFDKPVMAPGLTHDDFALRAFLPVTDVGTYVNQAGLDFVVSRFYSASSLQGEVRRALTKKQPPPEPLHYREHVQLQSQAMVEALQEFLSLQPRFWDNFPYFNARAPIIAPYIFWFMYRSTDALQQLQPAHRDLMHMLTSWIDENYANKYVEAEAHLAKGVVTLRTMPFITYPGDILIWKEKARLKAAMTSALLTQTSETILYWDSSQVMWSDDRPERGTKKGEFSTTWSVEAWNYKFIGQFLRERVPIEFKFKAASLDQEVEISKLAVYPLRFADEKTKLQLETRGRTFWSCRTRNLVSYTGDEGIFSVREYFSGTNT